MTKQHPHHHKVHHKPKSTKKILFISLAVVLIIISAICYFQYKGTIAASVGGENIYNKRVDALYNSLSNGSTLTKQAILLRLVDTKILVDYINKNGFGMSNEEFEKELKSRLNASGLMLEQLKKELTLAGATLSDVKDTFVIESFVDLQILPKITVNSTDIEKYREINPNLNMNDFDLKKTIYLEKQKQAIARIIASHKKEVGVYVSDKYEQ